jgi:trans-aconitate methyltransferase
MELKEAFNIKAKQYEISRPKYSKNIFRTIIKYKNLNNESNILEIGCGTGQATQLFINLNSKMQCLDIGENLIQIANNKFSNNKNIEFIKVQYEEYNCSIKYDLIFSATAYHWIKQPEGDIKKESILKDDGIFALFGNVHINQDEELFLDSKEIYTKYLGERKKQNDTNQ